MLTSTNVAFYKNPEEDWDVEKNERFLKIVKSISDMNVRGDFVNGRALIKWYTRSCVVDGSFFREAWAGSVEDLYLLDFIRIREIMNDPEFFAFDFEISDAELAGYTILVNQCGKLPKPPTPKSPLPKMVIKNIPAPDYTNQPKTIDYSKIPYKFEYRNIPCDNIKIDFLAVPTK